MELMSKFLAASTLSALIDRVSVHSPKTMKSKITEKSITYIVSYQRDGMVRTVAFGDVHSALQRVEEVSFDKDCRNLLFKKRVITVEESDVDSSDVRGATAVGQGRGGRIKRNPRAQEKLRREGLSQKPTKPTKAEDREKIQALETEHKERLKSLRIFLKETCGRTLPCVKSWAKEWLNNGQIIPDLLGGAVASKKWMASVLSLHLEGKPLNFGGLEGCPPYRETKYGYELLLCLDEEEARRAKSKAGSVHSDSR